MGDGDQTENRLKAQLILPFICTVAMCLAGIVGTQVLNRLDLLDKKMVELQIDIALVKLDIQYIKNRQLAEGNRP